MSSSGSSNLQRAGVLVLLFDLRERLLEDVEGDSGFVLVDDERGAARRVVSPQPSTIRPRSKARVSTRLRSAVAGSRVALSLTNSTPIIRPRPRLAAGTSSFSFVERVCMENPLARR